MVNTTTLLLVQDDLESLAAVLLGADTLADDLDGVNEVVEDGVVDSGQGARARTLLLLVGAGVDRALRAGQDAALSNKEDVAVGELLLELTGQSVNVSFCLPIFELIVSANIPLLDLVETLEERDGNEDDNSLASVTNLDLRILVSANCAAQCPTPLRSKYGCRCRCARARCAVVEAYLTSRAETNCRGRRELFRSGTLFSRSVNACIVLVLRSHVHWRRKTCVGDAGLDLGGALPRGGVGRNLVQGVGRHVGGWRC